MHLTNANETHGEKARRDLLHVSLEQILGATSLPQNNNCTVIYLPSNKSCKKDSQHLLEKQGWTHKRCTLMDSYTWTN